jgi:choline dehydrogenase-like flavoprotein
MKKRVVVVGAGLCGSLLSTLLRNDFEVTIVEQGRKKRPLFDDVECKTGELNTSINRGEGLGGTSNYWHNALIELDDDDLGKAGIEPRGFAPYYAKAWSLFLGQAELDECARARDANRASVGGGQATVAHMVLPQTRHNMWKLANARYPGDSIKIVHGHAQKIAPGYVEVRGPSGVERLDADYVIASAGGLATPVLLARSLGQDDAFCAGYHDHPMAYIAKVKLRPDSRLKTASCTTTRSAEVRAGLTYKTAGLKTVIYLRPAVDMRLGSITGPARYILSDLRNDPFSPKKILLLLGNLEAVREAILFKTRQGFRGDYYSVLILGEQTPIKTRGIQLAAGKRPSLNWHVTADELASYDHSVGAFFDEFASEIVERKALPSAEWTFRNAAHHSGTANQFVAAPGDTTAEFFRVTGLAGAFVCDGSLLRAAGIANSGLTLVALGYRLADLLRSMA